MAESNERNKPAASRFVTNESTQDDLEKRLTSLQKLSSVISSTLDLDEVMKIILDSMHTVLGFEYTTVSLVTYQDYVEYEYEQTCI